jgi:hypothetical protein
MALFTTAACLRKSQLVGFSRDSLPRFYGNIVKYVKQPVAVVTCRILFVCCLEIRLIVADARFTMTIPVVVITIIITELLYEP